MLGFFRWVGLGRAFGECDGGRWMGEGRVVVRVFGGLVWDGMGWAGGFGLGCSFWAPYGVRFEGFRRGTCSRGEE